MSMRLNHPNLGGVFIIIPVHNRRDITLLCLETLHCLGIADWASIIVVDDGSTDETSKAVAAQFPHVKLLIGAGNLWWTGGIVRGMRYALERGAETIIWLNDDCLPEKGALEQLVEYSRTNDCIAVAQAFTPSGYVYSGRKKTTFGSRDLFCPRGTVMRCDFFSGNCACIPAAVVAKIGLPDCDSFSHDYGDADYGLRASKKKIPIFILGDAICRNSDKVHPFADSWLFSDQSIRQLLGNFMNPIYFYYVPKYFKFKTRHWGFAGLIAFPMPYLRFLAICAVRIIVPRGILLRIYGKHSMAYKKDILERAG